MPKRSAVSTGLRSKKRRLYDNVGDGQHDACRDLASTRLSQIEGGDVFYIPHFISQETANQWYDSLLELSTWYHPTLKVYGKQVVQSRSIAAYAADESTTAKYSGHVVDMHYPYPPLLEEIQGLVEARIGEQFNHVMLNRYDTGKEYIGKHRDTKENKVIASLSLGAERTFIMSPNTSKDKSAASSGTGTVAGRRPHRWVLGNGSLLIMKGATQDNWKHEIPKEPAIAAGRISLTFRQLGGS